MTIGKSVYPMMQTLCANELYRKCQLGSHHNSHKKPKAEFHGGQKRIGIELTYSHPAA